MSVESSNLGRWADRYLGLTTPAPYGSTFTYELGAEWLAPCELVEDWGCGMGWFRSYLDAYHYRYRGIDGSASPFADKVVDLTEYRSEVPGIFMRHVIEHDHRWREILDNAVASFTERMVLILFTPLVTGEAVNLRDDPHLGVPSYSLPGDALLDAMSGLEVNVEIHDSPGTEYGVESVWKISR